MDGRHVRPRRLLGAAAAALALAPSPAAASAGEHRLAAGLTEVPRVVAPPTRADGATTARIVAAANARVAPGHDARAIWRAGTVTTWARRPQHLLVLGSAEHRDRTWLRVLLPIRPNGASGWIPADNVVLGHSPYWIEVRRRARRVVVFRAGTRVRAFRAVVGARRTPTPRGLAAIYERNPQPDPRGFLGPWALSLTALSRVLESYGGGPGRVAIHGRGGASLRDPLGSARSHGCVRVRNADVRWLARHVAPGTPVRVRR
jgi:lipoprotein-anchoring transpeptidase ErfK/SrfK